MVDTTSWTIGENNLGGDALALFQTRFSGEVINSFLESTVMLPHVRSRTVGPGQKTVTFPGVGEVTAGYHARGEDLYDPTNGLVQNVRVGEADIQIDDLLVAGPVSINNLDEFLNHWDVRGPIAEKLGRRLARETDNRLMQLVILGAAQATGITNDHPGGLIVTDLDSDTNGASLADSIRDVMQNFDEKDVPDEGRFVVLKPAQYNLLVEQTDLINRDFGNATGSLQQGVIRTVWGATILKSNHLPQANIAAVTGERNTYAVDASNTTAICFQSEAVGHAMAMGVATEMEYRMSHQANFMLAKMAVGSDYLRPSCCAQIQTA